MDAAPIFPTESENWLPEIQPFKKSLSWVRLEKLIFKLFCVNELQTPSQEGI